MYSGPSDVFHERRVLAIAIVECAMDEQVFRLCYANAPSWFHSLRGVWS